jgi:hypothetical protein
MRIYSNTRLTWFQLLHVSTAARIHVGRWQNYYFYRVDSRDPTNIITYSPISLLKEDREYYCYDKLQRNKLLDSRGNVFNMATVNRRPPPFPTELWVNIPYHAAANDVIVIRAQDCMLPSTSLASTSLASTSLASTSLELS